MKRLAYIALFVCACTKEEDHPQWDSKEPDVIGKVIQLRETCSGREGSPVILELVNPSLSLRGATTVAAFGIPDSFIVSGRTIRFDLVPDYHDYLEVNCIDYEKLPERVWAYNVR